MLKKFTGAALALFLVTGLALAQAKDQGQGRRGNMAFGKITKVDGDKITVAVRKRGEEATTEKVFTLTPDTKYFARQGGERKELKAEDAKAKIKEGATVVVAAGRDGKVKILGFGGGRGRGPRPRQ